MSRRNDYFRTISRKKPAKTPFYFTLCDSLIEEFRKRTGEKDYFEYFGMPFRSVSLKPSYSPPDYSEYFKDLEPVDEINEWGVGYVRGSMYHFRRIVPPMGRFEDPGQVWSFPLPDILADYRWEGMAERIAELKRKNDDISEIARKLRKARCEHVGRWYGVASLVPCSARRKPIAGSGAFCARERADS